MIIGSPTHFGNMAAPLKAFFDSTTEEWFNNTLENKLGGVFTSTSSMHGGQETTLLSMMLPLIHHGMVIAGVPFTVKKIFHQLYQVVRHMDLAMSLITKKQILLMKKK